MALMNSFRLRYGLRWKKTYPTWVEVNGYVRVISLVMILAVAVLALSRTTAIGEQIEQMELIKQSYQSVVLAAMNGDARFFVGTEMFECKGGKL